MERKRRSSRLDRKEVLLAESLGLKTWWQPVELKKHLESLKSNMQKVGVMEYWVSDPSLHYSIIPRAF
jgi:hypothetical protein